MEDIEITIKKIRLSLLKFNYDMENGTHGGLSSFLNEYSDLLRAFAGYKEAESYLSFKDEQTAIYNYLFKGENIYAIAKNNLSEGDTGAIIAFKQNQNPLDIIPDNRGIIKSSTFNPFADFVKKYSHLYIGDKHKTKAITKVTNLKDACYLKDKTGQSYNDIMEILKSRKLIYSNTGYWSGKFMTDLVGILQSLGGLGYTCDLKKRQIHSIMEKDFNVVCDSNLIRKNKKDKKAEYKIPVFELKK